jgi:hypothetical protein
MSEKILLENIMSKLSIIKSTMLFACIVLFITENCFAGAWTANKGSMYQKLSANFYYADQRFDQNSDTVDFSDNGEFTDNNISYYGEYGILDALTVIGSFSYKWLEDETDYVRSKTNGFSDLELGLKYRLFSGQGNVFSAQGLVKIPEFYDEDDVPSLGNSQYDTEIRLLYGQSLYPVVPGYFNIEAAYRFRAEAPADELRYLVEFGLDFTKQLYGRVKLDGIYGMGNEGNGSGAAGNPTATLDYDLGKLDACLGWKISSDWGIELGYRPEIYGKSTSKGTNWSFSLIYLYP